MTAANPMSQMAQASKLTITQLQQSLRNGTIDPIIGQTVLRQKIKLAEEAKRAAAMQQPQQPPVAQQNMAYNEAGIDTAPIPMQMAAGGIVAFADGGNVQHYANRGLTDAGSEDNLTPEEFAALTAGPDFTLYPYDESKRYKHPKLSKETTDFILPQMPVVGNYPQLKKDKPDWYMGGKPAADVKDWLVSRPTATPGAPIMGRENIGQTTPANIDPAYINQLLAQKNTPPAAAPAQTIAELIPESRIAGGASQRTRGKGIGDAAKGYQVKPFDDSELRRMLEGENNPETGKPFTYEEIAARNKQRAIAAGIDPDIYEKQQRELEGKKERPESRRKLDEAMPWFELSRALGETKAGEGMGTTIGRGLSAFGKSKAELSDKEEIRLEGIRKEANQLALAQNAFKQAEHTGNKADMKSAQDAIKATRLEMSKLGVESTKAQNDYAKTMAELQSREKIASMQESGAWGRASMDRNQVTQLANMYLKDAAAKGQPMTQSEAMEKAYYTSKFQAAGLGAEQRAVDSQRDAIAKEIDSINKAHPFGAGMSPETKTRLAQLQRQLTTLGTSGYNAGTGGAGPNVVDFNSLPK